MVKFHKLSFIRRLRILHEIFNKTGLQLSWSDLSLRLRSHHFGLDGETMTKGERRSLELLLSSHEHLVFLLSLSVGAPIVGHCGPLYAEARLRPVRYDAALARGGRGREEDLRTALAFLDLVDRWAGLAGLEAVVLLVKDYSKSRTLLG